MDRFIGVFDPTYEGGDFCAGLVFGNVGVKFLTHLATSERTKYLAKLEEIKKEK